MKSYKDLIYSAVFFLGFMVLCVLLKVVDVAAIGPEGTMVGLSGINGGIHGVLGYNNIFYQISKFLGILSFVPVVGFMFLGMSQLLKRKSLLRVDQNILTLGGLYVVVAILYIIFDKLSINYRPVLMEGEVFPEPSFPSTHTMIAAVVMLSAVLNMEFYIRNKEKLATINITLLIIGALVILFRFLSGVHWFTDILGGILISLALVSFYAAIMGRPKRRKKR